MVVTNAKPMIIYDVLYKIAYDLYRLKIAF